MGHGWELIFDLLIALTGALVLGLIAERIKVNAVIGYLLAGAILGPGGLKLIQQGDEVGLIAEIGVALLLFTIGLEFSWKRLSRLGVGSLLGGTGAILGATIVVAGVSIAFGQSWQAGIVLGAVASLSSTAIVLRILRGNNSLDTTHGKTALGILLLQDVAVVPLLLLVTFLSSGSNNVAEQIGQATWNSLILVATLVAFTSLVIPRLLNDKLVARNRELPILLAIVTCVGATSAAHELGLSPSLGAFFAGMLLADRQFADQMRADVLPLRTLFVTVFFVSIGLLADLTWLWRNLPVVLLLAIAVICLNAFATYLALRTFRIGIIDAIATAIAVAQVGEFSFVLLNIGASGGLIKQDVFQLVISVILVTLVATPALTGNALVIARKIAKIVFPARQLAKDEREVRKHEVSGHILLIGYGEAGQAAGIHLVQNGLKVLVLDSAHKYIKLAETEGMKGLVGDATQAEILETSHIHGAKAVVIAVSDHNIARMVASQCKTVSPETPIVARSRYHVFKDELDIAGADFVIDEENTVGDLLATTVLKLVNEPGDQSGRKFEWDSTDSYS